MEAEEQQTNKRAGDDIGEQEQRPPKVLRRMPVNEPGDVILLTRAGSVHDEKKIFYLDELAKTEEEDVTLTLFSRHLGSFRNGDRVKKHCSPWGESLRLHDCEWIVDHKVFDDDEEKLLFVVLRRPPPVHDCNNNFFMVNPAFFSGWTDAATRQLAHDAQTRAEAKESC
jgi:hypothetical protein